MKRIIAKLSIIMLIITVIFSPGSRISAEEEKTARSEPMFLSQRGDEEVVIVEQSTKNYFAMRQAFLQGKCEEEEFEKLINSGILEDEKIHRGILQEPFSADPVKIISVNAYYNEAHVTVEEFRNGNSIPHKVVLERTSEGHWLVVSDGYLDPLDRFESASYVDEAEAARILWHMKSEQDFALREGCDYVRGMMSNNSDQLRTLLVNKAYAQIGYYEKYINENLENYTANKGGGGMGYTKYGQIVHGDCCMWCAAFISWCANQVGISTGIIPFTMWVAYKEGHPDSAYNYYTFYNSLNRYHAKGTYTPKKGDIFIKNEGNNRHVGIVAYVSGTSMGVIHGNTPDQEGYYCVAQEVFSITDTRITGFANPEYCMGNNHSGNYSHNDTNHWRYCSVCGTYMNGIHEWVSMGSYYRCRVCGRTATEVSGPIYNGYLPVDR